MDNLLFTFAKSHPLPIAQPIQVSYDNATKTALLLDLQSILTFITFNPSAHSDKDCFAVRFSTQPLEQLQGEKVTFMEFLADSSQALIFTENGSIMTVNEDGLVDIKAQNDDGITGGSISPDQQYIYVVTNNNTLIQLDMQYDLVKEVPLDDHAIEISQGYEPRFSWKADGSHFAINIQTDQGRKCHTRDSMLGIFRTPSLSDPDPQGLVQSVSQKSRKNMSKLVSWQPSGGIIAGSDFINSNNKKINRVIFWEKNSLRHLEFNLPEEITDVLDIKWTPDSQILCVQVLRIDSSRWLYFYYRGNYHWYLKNTMALPEPVSYILTKNKRNNYLLLFQANSITTVELELSLNKKTYKSYHQQSVNPNVLCYAIDGKCLKVSNYANGIIPPPMSHRQVQLARNIQAADVRDDDILMVTEGGCVLVYNWQKNATREFHFEGEQKESKWILNGLNFCANSPHYEFLVRNVQKNGVNEANHYVCHDDSLKVTPLIVAKDPQLAYAFTISAGEEERTKKHISAICLQDEQLTLNGNQKIIDHCSSFNLYHQFLIFTCSTSDMYDQLYVLDMELDQWIGDEDEFSDQKIKIKIDDIVTRKLLNCRTIERGAKIVCCSRNRVVFQLPRGNLQAIFPKVIMIKHVKKCMESGKYQEAFETIRTHKLDLNLIYDLNPQNFTENAQKILLGFKKPDYVNLFVSQLKDQICSQLQYCLPPSKIEENTTYINIKLSENKISEVCSVVSHTLRKSQNMDKFILSIFTSDIKMGKLNDVLFQIKGMKENDVQIEVPPHLVQEEHKKTTTKKLNSQQILEYVCWLVDANAIYEASLLTYDLELAAMTARCTQMDPKEYIPYLQSLKQIEDQVELRKKICLDLKKYEKAVQELSKGTQAQKELSIELVEKHKIYRCGLKAYSQKIAYLKRVKNIIIEELLKTGENNQAYKLALSISDFDKALQIAVKCSEGKKIKQVLQSNPALSGQMRKERAMKILQEIGSQGFKNKSQYAKLLIYVGRFDEGVKSYLNAGNYLKAFKYFNNISEQLRFGNEFKEQMRLIFSLQKNLLLKEKKQIVEKSDRLSKVHKAKSLQGDTFTARNRQNDDMYSQVSVSSKTGSSYTISTTTGMRKKKDKKKSILTRNVKEGSLLEQEYIVALLHDAKTRLEPNIRETKLLIQYLIYTNLIEQAEILKNLGNEYAQEVKKCCPKYYAQVRFEADHPEFGQLIEVYEDPSGESRDRQKMKKPAIESFSYLF